MRLALFLIVVECLPTFASADYSLPTEKARRVVLAKSWKVKGTQLTVSRGKRVHSWKIDLFWLADRIDSDSICCGDSDKSMRNYLGVLSKKKGTSLWVELISLDGTTFFVAGLWPTDDLFKALETSPRGSRLLRGRYSGGKGRKPKTKAQVAKALERLDADGWKAIEAAKAPAKEDAGILRGHPAPPN